jgi:hypothetical protein
MYKRRWEELHDPKLADVGLEKRLESSIKGKDSANAYVYSVYSLVSYSYDHVIGDCQNDGADEIGNIKIRIGLGLCIPTQSLGGV